MTLRYRLGHELPDAFVKSAINYQVGACAERGAYALIVDRWPFSESCGSMEIYLDFCVRHGWRLTLFSFTIFLRGFFAALDRGRGLFFGARWSCWQFSQGHKSSECNLPTCLCVLEERSRKSGALSV